jgi:hypothetical protein
VPEKLNVNMGFFDAANTSDQDLVCESGSRWVWLASDRTVQGDLSRLGTVEYRNEDVTVLRIKGCDA